MRQSICTYDNKMCQHNYRMNFDLFYVFLNVFSLLTIFTASLYGLKTEFIIQGGGVNFSKMADELIELLSQGNFVLADIDFGIFNNLAVNV